MAEHTATPWKLCACGCGVISNDHHPIAKVEKGEWGDTYPAIRLIGTSLECKYEAYIKKIVYGEIPKEEAQANADFIVRAVNCHEELVAALDNLLTRTAGLLPMKDPIWAEGSRLIDKIREQEAKAPQP